MDHVHQLPGGDALAFVQSGIRRMPQRYDVRVRIAADHDTVARVVGRWGEVTPYDGGCLLTMGVDDLQWPVMVLAQVGADFEVLSPDELASEVARVSTCFARAAGVFRRSARSWGHHVVDRALSDDPPPAPHRSTSENALKLTKDEARELGLALHAVVEEWSERTRADAAADRHTYLLFSVLQPCPEVGHD